MNLFATVLTYPAPSANYRGESEENLAVIQKITYGRFEYPIISPEAIRNALRETLAVLGLPRNRTRLHDEEQLAVRFADYNDPDRYADDFFFGYLIAAGSADRKKILATLKERGRDTTTFQFKRDSLVRMNMARGLEPYRDSKVFTQSPMTTADSPWQNAKTSALLHRETVLTAFQYPFALNIEDCRPQPKWTKTLLQAIGELNGVAGNHARSYFEMAPASIVLRLTEQLVAGYDTYGFNSLGDFPEVVDGIRGDNNDYPASEFFLGGNIVREMSDDQINELRAKGATLDRDPRKVLTLAGERAFASEGA